MKPIEPSVRKLISALESVQDWSGTEVGDAIAEVESVLERHCDRIGVFLGGWLCRQVKLK
jgi:hypothetical protein